MFAKKIAALLGGACCACALAAQNLDVVGWIDADMVPVRGGTFQMGSAGYERNEEPVREVSVDGFFILKTEVTQDEYRAVMGVNLSHFRGGRRPVEEVSWYDAVVFCNKLSMLAGRTPAYRLNGSPDPAAWGAVPRIADADDAKAVWNGIECDFTADGYRLPTEAEWEYAAGGGPWGAGERYSGSSSVTLVAWNADFEDGETQDVATKSPNILGLYDMSGNVWEWCWDWYGNYRRSDRSNPRGADALATGRRIRRGGSVSSDAQFCRVANRASSAPDVRGVDLGFRIVRTAQDDTVFPMEAVRTEAPASGAARQAAPLRATGEVVEEVPVFDLGPDHGGPAQYPGN